jgi:hypothetical protein
VVGAAVVVPVPALLFTVAAPLAAALLAAFVETIPVRLDDNVSVPATAAAVLWIASLMTSESLAGRAARSPRALPWALGVNALTGWLGYRARTVSRSGAIAGVLVGAIIYAGGGAAHGCCCWPPSRRVGDLASRPGAEGTARHRGGARRPARRRQRDRELRHRALRRHRRSDDAVHRDGAGSAGRALTAGGSDTSRARSEKRGDGSTFLVTTFSRATPARRARCPSKDGRRTACGAGACGRRRRRRADPGLRRPDRRGRRHAGALVESALAATLEGPGILNNDMLNFINTAVAAAVAAGRSVTGTTNAERRTPNDERRASLRSYSISPARSPWSHPPRLHLRRADRVGAAPREPWSPALLAAPYHRRGHGGAVERGATTR